MAPVTSTFCLMKLTEWTFTHALEGHASRLIKKVCWSYSCVYLCALALAEMFGSVRIKSNCVEVMRVKNMQFKTFIPRCILQSLCFFIPQKKPFSPRSLLSEQNHPGSLQCSFESGWNTVLIWCCRPHCRTNSHRAQVNILSWNIELILNLDSEDCTNPTAAHISSDPSQTVVLCVHNFTMETSKLHLKRYFLLSTHCIIQMQGRAPVLHVLLNAALTSLSDCWRKR